MESRSNINQLLGYRQIVGGGNIFDMWTCACCGLWCVCCTLPQGTFSSQTLRNSKHSLVALALPWDHPSLCLLGVPWDQEDLVVQEVLEGLLAPDHPEEQMIQHNIANTEVRALNSTQQELKYFQ